MEPVKSLLDKLRSILQGEPALVIGNGAAVVIYLVANAVDAIPDLTFEAAVLAAVGAIGTLNTVLLTIRHYVYSPKTVAELVLDLVEANAVPGVVVDPEA